jgi:hypothetical protein
MARIKTSKTRHNPKIVQGVTVLEGDAVEHNSFKSFKVGHETAVPTTDNDGNRVYRTPSGKKFRTKKMSS